MVNHRKNESIVGIVLVVIGTLPFVLSADILEYHALVIIPAIFIVSGLFFVISIYFEKVLLFYGDRLSIDSFRGGHTEIQYSEMRITQLIPVKQSKGGVRNVFKVCKVGEEFLPSPLLVYDDKISSLNATLYEWLKPQTKGFEDFKSEFHSEEEKRMAIEQSRAYVERHSRNQMIALFGLAAVVILVFVVLAFFKF